MSLLFLDKEPEKITSRTLLVDLLEPTLAFKALQNRCVSVTDLVKLVKSNELNKIVDNNVDQAKLKDWLTSKGLIRNRTVKTKSAVVKNEYAPNPKIVPLEKIQLDLGLDGRTVSNRGNDSMKSLEATDDLSAIKAWLAARACNPNTQGVYRKEAERFLLWCTVEKNIAMSSVGVTEASDYLRWLEELGRFFDFD